MGHVVVYCFKCGSRLLEEDFKEGKAFAFQNKSSCVKCAMAVLSSLPQEQQDSILRKLMAPDEEAKKPQESRPGHPDTPKPIRPSGDSQRLHPHAGPNKPPTSRYVPNTRRSVPTEHSNPLAAIVGGAVLLLVVVLTIFMSRSGGSAKPVRVAGEPVESSTPPPPPTPDPGPAPTPDPPKPPPDPKPKEQRLAKASRLLADATEFAANNSGKLLEIVPKFREALWEAEGTELESTVRRAMAPYEKQLKDIFDKTEPAVASKVKKLTDVHKYGDAIRVLEDEIKACNDSEWVRRMNARIAGVNQAADRQFESRMKTAQRLADEKRFPDAVQELGAVKEFGLPRLQSRADEKIAAWKTLAAGTPTPAPVDPPKPPAEDPATIKAAMADYEKAWQESAQRAFERSFDKAVEAQAALVASVSHPKVAEQAQIDQSYFAGLLSLYPQLKASLQSLVNSRSPIEFRYLDGAGRSKSLRGTLVTVDGDALEIRDASKKEVWLDANWLSSETLVTAHKNSAAKSDSILRSYAVFCLFDGNVDDAKKLLGDRESSIPERYWAFARRVVAEKLSRPRSTDVEERAKKETEAKALYERAEKESKSSPAAAAQKFQQLLDQFAQTALVKKHREAIDLKAAFGRETWIPVSEAKSTGGWSKKDHGLMCPTDHVQGGPVKDYLDFEVSVVPGTQYRVWFYTGACCQELSSFYVQGDDVVFNNPMPVGGNNFGISPPANGLPGAHASCPKNLQWLWTPGLISWTPTAGSRRIRVLGIKNGQAIGGIFLSSKNYLNAPPPDPKTFKSK